MTLAMGIRAKLTILFTLLTLLPLGGLGVLTFYQGEHALRMEIGQRLAATANAAVAAIDQSLYFLRRDLQVWAKADPLQRDFGDPLAVRQIQHFLRSTSLGFAGHVELFLFAADGRLIASSAAEEAALHDVGDAEWFLAAMQTEQVSIRDLTFDGLLNRHTVAVSIPVYNQHAARGIAGILSLQLEPKHLYDLSALIVKNDKIRAKSGFVVLVGKNSFALVGPDFLFTDLDQEVLADLGVAGESAMRRAAVGENGFIESHAKGTSWLLGYAGSVGYRDFTGTGWTILLAQDTRLALYPVYQLGKNIAIVASIIGLLAIVLSIVVADRINVPLLRLTRAAKATALGNFSQVSVESRDEVGLLAESFNQMVQHIKARDQALHESEALSRSIVETADEGIITVNQLGIVQSFNPAAQKIFELSAQMMIGKSINLLVPGAEPSNQPSSPIASLLFVKDCNEVIGVNRELMAQRASGAIFPVQIVISEVPNTQGSLFTVFVHDVTEQLLAKQQLEAARDKAMESSRLKSEFVANMSHEIRTPLNGVLGMTELLLESELDEQQKKFAITVHRCGESLLGIINDILDFSKIEAGKLELDYVELNLREVLENVCELFAERAHRKGVELASFIDPDVQLAVKCDPIRLQQVLSNLIGNAIKFTDSGEVICRIYAIDDAEHLTTLCFEVRDSGIGLTKDQQEKIFESFSQADGTTTRKYGGTGLGLTICKQLLKLMGGHIGVSSEPGAGATFRFTLQLEKVAGAVTIDRPVLPEGLRVLLVDDNEVICEHLRLQFMAWGAQVQVMSDPMSVIDHLQQGPQLERQYDLLLIDREMPQLNGMVLIERIAKHPVIPVVPIILVNSISDRIDRTLSATLQIRHQISKPLRSNELLRYVEDVVGSKLDTAQDVSAAPAKTSDAAELRAGKVLVAEDNAVNRELLSGMLNHLGVPHVFAETGREALQCIAEHEVALILMDCSMPDMDGFEATEQIRQMEQHDASCPRLPIIAVTADAMAGDREQCLASGMDDYLCKPFTRKALVGILQKWLPVDLLYTPQI